MRQGWEIKKLGDVCEYDKQQGQFNNHIYVGLEDIQSNTGEFIGLNEPKKVKSTTFKFSNKHLLYGRLRPYLNKVLVPSFGGHCSTEIFPIKVNGTVDRQFLARWLMQEITVEKINYTCTGARMPRANMKEVLNFQIPVPPLPEQKRIVAILDKVFAAIAEAKANAEQNLKNAKELFENYLQGVFGNKGEGWEEKTLGELCELTRGHNPPKQKFINEPKEGYIRFYQIRDGWSDDYMVYVPDTPQLHRVEPSDILMVAYRHIGKVFRGVSGAFNVALCKISNISRDLLEDDFLFYMIPTDVIKGELMKRSERSLIPSMSVNHLKEISIPLPPLSEQQSIIKKLDVLSAETKKLETIYQQKIEDLEELKKSVLQKAFKGELT